MKILSPLRERDFALLWAGLTVSLLGDGIYLVAVAWQAYDLSNTPSALALVGLAWSAGLALFVLTGGVLSDRMDRRRVLIVADLLRAVALGVIGVLAVTGDLAIGHLIAFVVLYAAGDALFGPALGALVPDLVSKERLAQANALEQVMRQTCRLLIGPALGGIVVALVGPGDAFLIDAGTFLVSAVFVSLIRTPSRGGGSSGSSMLAEARAGIRYAASQRWLWGTLLMSTLGMFFFFGPMQVLLPYLIRNELDAGSQGYGLVLAADGVGAVLVSFLLGQRGVPRRYLTAMYAAFAIGCAPLIGYALGTSVWQLMLFAAVSGAAITGGLVIFTTLQQAFVPSEMLGRVQSLEWFSSAALVPVSFAVTSPVSALLGAHTTLIVAGAIAATVPVLMYVVLRLGREQGRPLPRDHDEPPPAVPTDLLDELDDPPRPSDIARSVGTRELA